MFDYLSMFAKGSLARLKSRQHSGSPCCTLDTLKGELVTPLMITCVSAFSYRDSTM